MIVLDEIVKTIKPRNVYIRWSPEEFDKLMNIVKMKSAGSYPKDWNAIAEAMGGGRNYKQCRDKYNQTWPLESLLILFELVTKYGSSLSEIAKHMPERKEMDIKNKLEWANKNGGLESCIEKEQKKLNKRAKNICKDIDIEEYLVQNARELGPEHQMKQLSFYQELPSHQILRC